MTSREVRVKLSADVSAFQRGMLQAASSAKALSSNLDAADSRLANLAQAGMALGPALVPIGAAAVPAIAGLATQLGLAVAAAGTAVFAFNGVGDALGALNKFKLDPTAENLAKVREEMRGLGPEGQDFVFFLRSLGPELQDLQDAAGSGLFPGLTQGIEELLAVKPQFESLLKSLGTGVGNLTADAGAGLASPQWVEFFEFLDREAQPTLEAMGKALGNFVTGLAEMVMAFEPASDDFTDGLLNMSESFREWAEGLDSSQSFQDFLEYIRTSGPLAGEALGAIAEAIIALVQAAAPVGQAVLPLIEALADGFASLASSPIGPVLVATAAGIGVIGRSLALLRAVGLRGDNQTIFSSIFDTSKIKEGVNALGTVTSAQDRATKSAAALMKVEQERQATIRAGLGQMGKLAAGAAAVGVATTGMADGLGLANTATFALMGAMIGGGPGAAGGALIGAFMDVDAAASKGKDAIAQFEDAIDSTTGVLQKLQAARDESEMGTLEGIIFGDRSGGMQNALDDSILAVNYLGKSLGLLQSNTDDLATLDGVLANAGPAMEALGISFEDLVMAGKDGSIIGMVEDIQAWQFAADTTQGRTALLTDAVRDLGSETETTATSAERLKNALDAILGPELNVSEATDSWTAALRNLNDDLAEHSRALRGNTNGALQNRDAIRDRVSGLQDLLVAEAEAGAGSGRLARILRNQRQALLDAGEAAGLSRNELRAYLADLGLTPKLVRTILDTVDEGKPTRKAVGAELKRLMERVVTPIDADPSGALSGAAAARAAIATVQGKTVIIDVIKKFTDLATPWSANGNIFAAYAHGDIANGHQPELAGPGPTRMWREPETGGEAYIPLRNDSRRPRAKSILETTAGMLGGEVFWYAGGGNTGSSNFRGRPGGGMGEADKAAKGLAKRLKEAQAELERETAARSNLRSKMQEFASEVRGSFDNDPFGNGLAGLDLQLEADRNDAQAMKRALQKARKKGLDGGLFAALAASGDLNTAQQFAGLSKAQIRQRERLFAQTNKAQAGLAQFATQEKFGSAMRDSSKAIRELRQEIQHLRKRLPGAVEDGARKGVGDQNRRTQQRSRTR